MEKSLCPGADYLDNRCPGGNNIKCCRSVSFQEPECETEGGVCAEACGCPGGNTLDMKCPSQPAGIKCCLGDSDEEELVENCNGEEGEGGSTNECLSRILNRSSDCSSEPSEACAAEGGYCGDPSSCPADNVVDNKCPGGNNNKCCLTFPFQESSCESEGGECSDR